MNSDTDVSNSMNSNVFLQSHLNLPTEDEIEIVKTPLEPDIELKLFKCEKCDQMIPQEEFEAHVDFHVAMELDRQLNPNKKKYKRSGDSAEDIIPSQKI